MQNIVDDFREVIVRCIDPSDYKHLQSENITFRNSTGGWCLANRTWLWEYWLHSSLHSHYFNSKRTHRGKLIVELRQHGVMGEDGRVFLKSLQLLHETLFVFFTAVPGGHWLKQGLPCSVTPLQDHHLHIQISTCNTWPGKCLKRQSVQTYESWIVQKDIAPFYF